MEISRTKRSLYVAAGLVLLLAAVYWHVKRRRQPIAPSLPRVASCKLIPSGFRRIGDRYGYEFDASTTLLRITEGTTDASPLQHGFRLQPWNSSSTLNISFGPPSGAGAALDPETTFLKHLEKRTIIDSDGHTIGEDEWGYLKSGEQWRKLLLPGTIVEYNLVNSGDAGLFDKVLSSVCFLPPSAS